MITLREAAREAIAAASTARDVAGRVDGPDYEHQAAAKDLRAFAANLDHWAANAERVGIRANEPDPDDWIATAAPGELVEVFGR